MQLRSLYLASLLMCCVPTIGNVLPRHEAKTFQWTFSRRKGQVARYQVHTTLSGHESTGAKLEVDATATVRREVVGVAANGDATFQETVEARKLLVNGQTVPKIGDYPVVTQTLSARGVLMGYKLQNAAPKDNPAETEDIIDLSAMLSQTPAPPKPAHPGETWKSEIKNRWVPGGKIIYLSTLVGPAKIGGKDVLHVKFSMEIPLIDHPGPLDSADASGEYDVDPSSGTLVRIAYKAESVQFHLPTSNAKGVLSARFELLGPDGQGRSPVQTGTGEGKNKPVR